MTDRRIEVVAEVHSRAHMGADGVEADEKAWKWHWLNCAYCYNLTNVVVQSLDADWVAHLWRSIEVPRIFRGPPMTSSGTQDPLEGLREELASGGVS